MSRPLAPGGTTPLATPPPERVFTPGLLVFLAVVAGLIGYGLWHKQPRPDLAGGVQLLADGDLDGYERGRMLQRVLQQAETANEVRAQWAGLLAALALDDRAGWERFAKRLSRAGRLEVPPPAEREWLGLGDPLLEAVLAAAVAEGAGDVPAARAAWASARDQAALTGRVFPRELAAAALQRLR